MAKELDRIIDALEDQGFEARPTKNGHWVVYREGRRIATLAGTPSDGRSWLNSLAPLKREGFIPPGTDRGKKGKGKR